MAIFDGQKPLKLVGAIAGSGLSASTAAYRFVKFSADNTVVLCSGTTDIPCGVLQAPAPAGDPVEVVVIGQTFLQADASISVPGVIATSADGQAQTAVSTQYVAGQAVSIAGGTAAGNLISAVVNCAAPSIKA